MQSDLVVSSEVAGQLAAGRPVVALESTIITHGMPFPANRDTALAVEAVVREAGAVPATLAVIDGRLRVGLSASEIDDLGRRTSVAKASRRDLALLVATGGTAGTTVAATMILAAMAGIEVFATGGIGGVHRGAELTWDVSADLMELGRTPVTVVSAGAKSILDLPKTLEVLETQGVPVIGVGTAEFPAFFSRDSGLALDHRLDRAEEIAAVIAAQRRLGLKTGILVANPIPADASLPAAVMAERIATALAEAEAAGITGKAVTPFLLSRLVSLTEGASLTANIALIRANARLAAEIAVALATRMVAPTI
ncbi:MAG: pseudouridine-5'-phosphate glycosidase [Alphaproteobacteria bacterium]|nr:MAG: pseudouridine-5'-phosphate glycosidase [Alphaproteobacteria bacterium]